MRVTTAQVAQFVQALPHIDVADRKAFRDAARCTLVSHRDELPAFDRLFAQFWSPAAATLAAAAGAPRDNVPSRGRAPAQVGLLATPRSPPSERAPDTTERTVVDRVLTYSGVEILRRKRFEELSQDELTEVERMLRRLTWRVEERRSRRHRRAPRGPRLDWRRTIAAAIRHDGEWIARRWQQRARVPRPLVVLADVSGSMERYTRLLLTFLHTLTRQGSRYGRRQRVETFLFGTRLTRTTRALATRNIDGALAEVGRHVVDWAGGTRIGDSVHLFNRVWSRRVLGRGAVVIIISDGWDRGDPALVGREIARLRRSCSRLVWLNPLIGTRAFAPRTRGLVAALPYVDDFLPVHDLTSLEALARHLEALPALPCRRRSPRVDCAEPEKRQ